MISIGDAIVSSEILEEAFVCDLSKCKGACCVGGDAGAPLNEEEASLLDDLYDEVKPYLRPEGIKAIESQGKFVMGQDGELETPLVNNEECAYVIFEGGITKCGIEKAHEDGVVDYKKPISCHLYPIRIQKYSSFEAVNYERWDICAPACDLGASLKVPIYAFLKEPLIRKYGPDWYGELEEVAKHWPGTLSQD